MQIIILCGGSGTRLREETEFRPKPMIHIGGKPMLWHIMKIYSHYGYHKFILALGYKQEMIKEYFYHFNLINNDIKMCVGEMPWDLPGRQIFNYWQEKPWEVILADTGEKTFKGSRLKRVEQYVEGDNFMMTYGDGVADINIQELVEFHLWHGKIATVTGVYPTPRFGEIHRDGSKVLSFTEKPDNGDCLINGGFMVFKRDIFKHLTVAEWCDLEVGPLELLAAKGELMVYHHKGYWGCLDTIRDMDNLNRLCETGQAKWRIWDV